MMPATMSTKTPPSENGPSYQFLASLLQRKSSAISGKPISSFLRCPKCFSTKLECNGCKSSQWFKCKACEAKLSCPQLLGDPQNLLLVSNENCQPSNNEVSLTETSPGINSPTSAMSVDSGSNSQGDGKENVPLQKRCLSLSPPVIKTDLGLGGLETRVLITQEYDD